MHVVSEARTHARTHARTYVLTYLLSHAYARASQRECTRIPTRMRGTRTVSKVTVDGGLKCGWEGHDMALESRELANKLIVVVKGLASTQYIKHSVYEVAVEVGKTTRRGRQQEQAAGAAAGRRRRRRRSSTDENAQPPDVETHGVPTPVIEFGLGMVWRGSPSCSPRFLCPPLFSCTPPPPILLLSSPGRNARLG